jgi:SgrR family transcriptional regulator
MDRHLLTLWNLVKSGDIKSEEIAHKLMLSRKQTRRKLQEWQEEDWLEFQPGRGRGNASSLTWVRNVEQEYEQLFLKKLEEKSIEDVSKLLLLNWSPETKQLLMTAFQTKFGFQQEGGDALVIPRFYPFLTFHPLEAADVHSANIVPNLFNRLVTLHADNSVSPELAHTWEVNHTSLVLYVRKDVAFHDGSILKAEDVVCSLQRMKEDEYFGMLWEPVTSISTPAPLVVRLDFPSGCTYALQLLGLLSASIYKEGGSRLLGTGGFYLGENSPEKTVLTAFKQHFGHRPLLDSVEFIQVPKEFQVVYHAAHEADGVDTFEVESDSGFGVVVLNPDRHPDMKRKVVRDFLHKIIAEHRHELAAVNSRITGNHEGCLIGLSEPYTMPDVSKPELSEPLKIRLVNYTSDTSHWLKDKLEGAGLEVEMEEVSFHDAIYNSQTQKDTDLFIHGEIFELNQAISYFLFLKNCYSPLHFLIQRDEYLQQQVAAYNLLPYEKWNDHHLQIEEYLISQSLCVPLYYVKRQIPFSINLMNVEIKHFGYVDLTRLWTKPGI